MNYHLNRGGQNIGVFPLEELRRQRSTGELTGTELVWCAGMANWQTLDSVLYPPIAGGGLPPVISAPAASTPQKTRSNYIILFVSLAGILLFLVGTLLVGLAVKKFSRRAGGVLSSETSGDNYSSREDSALALASKPVTWTTNTVTQKEVRKQAAEFRRRQWLEGYKANAERRDEYDAEALGLIENWIASNYGGEVNTNLPSLSVLSDKLATNSACDDPLILTVSAVNAIELHEAIRRLERALTGFERSKHKGYPRFYTAVTLSSKSIKDKNERLPVLDATALRWMKEGFKDGSFIPDDQAELAEILIEGWGKNFFKRNTSAVVKAVTAEGEKFKWLALVLQGEFEIDEAWRARGSGYANTVSSEGWKGFREHLGNAREALNEAWQLRPDLPMAPTRMISVALGDSDLDEMRQWFDRAVEAQVDYPRAWSAFRWGLRPRWYGDMNSMLALGVTAVNTKRFDTDVPRMFFDVVADLETELKTPRGEHIYGRADIWPHMQRMYEGYIAETAQTDQENGWRSTYTAVAYLAEEYEVAQKQLEKLNWQPRQWNLTGWGRDISLMPLEVAARTGKLGPRVVKAETYLKRGDMSEALRIYTELSNSSDADERTRAFVQDRLVTLKAGQQLQAGSWVDLMPTGKDFTGWHVVRGKCQVLPDGALEVESGPEGHLLYSRVPMGLNFEVKGNFEVVRSSNRSFQAGLVMGLPHFETYGWYAFRVKRNDEEGEISAFSEHWTKKQIFSKARLNDTHNSFTLRFQNGKVTATVNNQEMFQEVPPPENYYLPNDFLLGFGAFNDMNDTTLRYRNVQVRKL